MVCFRSEHLPYFAEFVLSILLESFIFSPGQGNLLEHELSRLSHDQGSQARPARDANEAYSC